MSLFQDILSIVILLMIAFWIYTKSTGKNLKDVILEIKEGVVKK